MLYNGQVVIADTFLRNRPNHGQTLISDICYSGHFFEHRVNILDKIYPLIADTSMIGYEKRKQMHVFI